MIKLNQKAHDHAMEQISKGNVDYTDVHPYLDDYASMRHIAEKGIASYAKWHLGKSDNEEGMASYKYPTTSDFKHVSRSVIKHSVVHAAHGEHTHIMRSGGILLNQMGSNAPEKEPDPNDPNEANEPNETQAKLIKIEAIACTKNDKRNGKIIEISIITKL